MLLTRLIMTAWASLLTLALFDDNAWWLVLIFSAFTALINSQFDLPLPREGWKPLGKGFLGAGLALLAGALPIFRTTPGTLIGFALLLAWGEFLIKKINIKRGS
ncbi:MAG: hypothetical protein GX335_02155 [Firmicutes bacterium]|nr:hypothetical protein [Bacillota bacterium]